MQGLKVLMTSIITFTHESATVHSQGRAQLAARAFSTAELSDQRQSAS